MDKWNSGTFRKMQWMRWYKNAKLIYNNWKYKEKEKKETLKTSFLRILHLKIFIMVRSWETQIYQAYTREGIDYLRLILLKYLYIYV